jgi:hypothetical protein
MDGWSSIRGSVSLVSFGVACRTETAAQVVHGQGGMTWRVGRGVTGAEVGRSARRRLGCGTASDRTLRGLLQTGNLNAHHKLKLRFEWKCMYIELPNYVISLLLAYRLHLFYFSFLECGSNFFLLPCLPCNYSLRFLPFKYLPLRTSFFTSSLSSSPLILFSTRFFPFPLFAVYFLFFRSLSSRRV